MVAFSPSQELAMAIPSVSCSQWAGSPDTGVALGALSWHSSCPVPARSRPAQATFGPASNTAPEQDFFSEYLETRGRRQAKAWSPSTVPPPPTVREKGKEAGRQPHLPPQSSLCCFKSLTRPLKSLPESHLDVLVKSWTLKCQG